METSCFPPFSVSTSMTDSGSLFHSAKTLWLKKNFLKSRRKFCLYSLRLFPLVWVTGLSSKNFLGSSLSIPFSTTRSRRSSKVYVYHILPIINRSAGIRQCTWWFLQYFIMKYSKILSFYAVLIFYCKIPKIFKKERQISGKNINK